LRKQADAAPRCSCRGKFLVFSRMTRPSATLSGR
jgi:hypothetical protein